MLRIAAVCLLVAMAGCAGDPATAPAPAGSAAPCASLDDIAAANLAVILTNVTWGLGPDGAIRSGWSNGTIEVVQAGEVVASVRLDARGCGVYQPPALGEYLFRARATDGTCSLAGNATIVQTPDAGHVVRLGLDFPCA